MISELLNNIKEAHLKLQELQQDTECINDKLIYRYQCEIINSYCEYLYITRSKNAYWNHYRWGHQHPEEEIKIITQNLNL